MPIVAWILSKLTAKIALPVIGVLLLANIASGAGLAITRHTLADARREQAAEIKAHEADVATFKAATAQAKADDELHAIAVKTAEDQISTEKQNDLQNQLASTRSNLAKWVLGHQGPAAPGGSVGKTNLPGTANPTSGTDATNQTAIVPLADLDACAVAVTVAQGWQDWWAKELPSMTANGAFIEIPPMAANASPALLEPQAEAGVENLDQKPAYEQENDINAHSDEQDLDHKNFLP